MKSLRARAWFAFVTAIVVMGVLLFIPAGTIYYWQAWVYLVIFGGASALSRRRLLRHDPDLAERRIRRGPTAEKRPVQKLIMLVTSIGLAALLLVPAYDRRLGWSQMPLSIVIAGDVLVAIAFVLIGRVYRENSFTSAIIEVAEDQTVVSTGPYAIVRHPMYASGAFYLLGTPLALGSYWGLLPIAAMAPFLLWRLVDEEHFLAANLPGYSEYRKQVRHRLVPFVW